MYSLQIASHSTHLSFAVIYLYTEALQQSFYLFCNVCVLYLYMKCENLKSEDHGTIMKFPIHEYFIH